jgi:hopanoid C-3 methylase
MKVLLVKPRPQALQFGLAPFFQTEPLGLEYIAAELRKKRHLVVIEDMRFNKNPLSSMLKIHRPDVIGLACLHILDAKATLRLAREAKAFDANIFVVVGGHAASAYPEALDQSTDIDAICIGEGEIIVPALCNALEERESLEIIPSLALPANPSGFKKTTGTSGLLDLGEIALPDRSLVSRYRKHYCCLNYMPIWAMETTRGCPHHCKFCSVWQLYRGSCRFHPAKSVRADFAATGDNLFIIDDIFWADRDHSTDLSRELMKSGTRKNWILVQSRTDTVAENPALLEQWRPLARNFDIFFGFESATKKGLDSLNKTSNLSKTIEAIIVARRLGFGVTGNFIVDPAFAEEDFARLWEFVDAHQLYRVGFTILTPLPGTHFFDQMKDSIQDFDWNHYDLHHLLWPSQLPVGRFFELYCQSWRHSVLNLAGKKKLWNWFTQVKAAKIPRLIRILWRTQKLMNPKVYLAETMASPVADSASLTDAASFSREK